jgi:glycosyltransferase involved in cell wall biosynthesis
VLAPRNGSYYRDPEIEFPEESVIRTSSLELSRVGKRALRAGGDDVRPASVGQLRGALRDAARATLYFPDAQVGWCAPAIVTVRRTLRNERFDAIFSSSFPITAHLIARRLHRRMKIPWIAEFRDPWSQTLPGDGRTHRRALKLERSIAREAKGIVMTSPAWAALHSKVWDKPVTVIPNGHDGAAPTNAAEADDAFTLTYLGSFYPAMQRLDAVWKAVVRLNGANAGGVSRLKFIGDLHPFIRRELHDHALDSLVEVTGFLPYTEALAELNDSSVLLVAGPHDARGLLRGHIVAKLFEYLSTNLPIVYVGDRECDAADLLRQFPGCHIISTDDVAGIERALHASWGKRFQRDVDALSRRALTGHLAELLDQACDG